MTNETTHSRNHLGGRPLRLVLSAAPAHTSIRGRMTSRGVSVDLEFGSKDQHQFEIVVPASVEAGLTVGLVVHNPRVPAREGESSDSRVLGLLLKALGVSDAQ